MQRRRKLAGTLIPSDTRSHQDITSDFTDLSYPKTLTIKETFTFAAFCNITVTAVQTVYIGGEAFYAVPITVTSVFPTIIKTWNYPSVTLSSITSFGPNIQLVSSSKTILTVDRELVSG